MKKIEILMISVITAAGLIACAPQGLMLKQNEKGRQIIREIKASETGITISGSQPFVYLILREYQDSMRPRLVVLRKETDLGRYRKPILVNKGPVTEIIPNQIKGKGKWSTEIRIELNRHVDYQVNEKGNKLMISLKGGSDPDTEKVALGTDVDEIEPRKNDISLNKHPVNDFKSSYVIGPEDVLEILIWKNDDLSRVVTVRPDGNISLPLIGEVRAAGLDPEALRDVIVKRVSEYQIVPGVSVIVTEVNSYNVYILGEVNTPGKYQLKSNTTLLQVISLAGGFTPFASKNNIKVLRKKNLESQEEVFKIRYKDIVSKEDATQNITLKPGDTIVVP
jgi:polysaccharide biosynthesis/export protein